MIDVTNADPSPLGPLRPSFELTSLRVITSLIDISLEIQNGILNVWFGANGSGKSLMLHAVRAVLRGDYSEFADNDDVLFMATFDIPQNVDVLKKIRDRVDRDYWSDDQEELVEEDALTLEELLERLENSLLNPSSDVARPRISLSAQSRHEESSEYWTLEFGRDFGDSSTPQRIELESDFRNGLEQMFPQPVVIDNNFINALPDWLPRNLVELYISQSVLAPQMAFDLAEGKPLTASEFFAITPVNPETAHTEVEWNVRVKEVYQELMEQLIETTHHFLPTFVSESWIVTHQFSPPTFGNQSIQIKLRSRDSGSDDWINLTNASEGVKRWVTISLAIASISLSARLSQEGEQYFLDLFDDQERVEVPHYYFLMDEPEAHLSSKAIDSLASPIAHLAPMTTLITTHSPRLIDGLEERATFRGIRGTGRTKEIDSFSLTDFVDLRGFEKEMGLRASELLLRSGRLLLVEGDHDAIVLKHWFGVRLEDRGIYVVKTSGTSHLNAILKLPLIRDVSKRVAVLLDKSKYELPTYLEDVEARVFELDERDILYYVPVGFVRAVNSEFPTWYKTWSDYNSNGIRHKYMSQRDPKGPTSQGWKRYIDAIYGLNLSFKFQSEDDARWENDLNKVLETAYFQSIRQSPEEQKRLDELAQKVDMILNWFEEPPSRNT